jgi:rubrerythrin
MPPAFNHNALPWALQSREGATATHCEPVAPRRLLVSTTADNLREAFAGESQANRKYLAFAEKAEKDGFPNVARLFRTAAEAETIHAMGHLNAMGGVGSTADNLQAAIDGETYEYTRMYPPMLEEANSENHRAKRMFGYAVKAEAVHAELYQRALEAVKAGNDLTETAFYLCPVCGHIEFGQPPDACPICGAKKDKFTRL